MNISIYHTFHTALGNQWCFVNACRRLSAELREPVTVSRWHDKVDTTAVLEEIGDLLDAPGLITISNQKPTAHLIDDWNVPYYPTRQRWSQWAIDRRIIGYQFDGRTHPERTNPSTDEMALWDAWCASFPPYDSLGNVQFVRLGQPMTITEIAQRLAWCSAFIGVDSGVSHIAHSVGVPTFLLQYVEPLVLAHPRQYYVKCDGMSDAIDRVSTFLDCRTKISP